MQTWSWLAAVKLRSVAGAFCALVLLGGCGSTNTTIIRTVTAAASSATTSAATTTANASSTAVRPLGVGSSTTIDGNGAEKMRVTLMQVLDPVAGGQIDTPAQGARYVGVMIRLSNVGPVAYSDSPGNGATLLSAGGEQANSTTLSGGPCSSDFASSAKIAPGESQMGCVPFELSSSTQPARFQFTLSSGFADQTAEWTISATSNGAAVAPSGTGTQSGTSTGSPSGGSGDPLSTVQSYWSSISAGGFSAAYADLVPGSIGQTESQFIAGEQQSGIQSVQFNGHTASNDGSTAAVNVDSLIIRDSQFGCRTWSGSYRLTSQGGQWLIGQASITPRSCG